MLRMPKRSKIEFVAPKEEDETASVRERLATFRMKVMASFSGIKMSGPLDP
jgi:hypothetical protein